MRLRHPPRVSREPQACDDGELGAIYEYLVSLPGSQGDATQ